ncbi:MAG TPA: glutamate-cysteine ligase family protein [Polyangiaceae bacterium]|nr:glutamate-cysteine ligase family protein [Polyangiaceae bacterium]
MNTSVPAPDGEHRPITDLDELTEIFRGAEKPPAKFRIGAEAEKFAVVERTGAPLDYEHGVVRVFSALEKLGWHPERETPQGPVVALQRGSASVTLEPGAQLELSGSAVEDLHAIEREFTDHLRDLAGVSRDLGLAWLSVGFHPLARQVELPWVPKIRYGIMKEYLPTKGRAAHDMMRRTATVQANFDFSSEEDAMRKLMVALRLSPLIHALTANAPFSERRVSPLRSVRGDVWLHMDPSRSGLIPPLWEKQRPTYRDYVDWALGAGMFLFKRGDRVIQNTGQSFRGFLEGGFRGERATVNDFRLHLQTLFPEARLKNTLEVRACDAQSGVLTLAVPALFTGLFYDDKALDEAEAFSQAFELETLEAARPALVKNALRASIGAEPTTHLAVRLLEIASDGLARRARLDAEGRDERRYLEPLVALAIQGRCPADMLVQGLAVGQELPVAELVARTRLELPPPAA